MDTNTTPKETKNCPMCGEEILAVAKKCKHCGSMLDGSDQNNIPVNNTAQQTDPKIELLNIIKENHESAPDKIRKKLQVLIGEWIPNDLVNEHKSRYAKFNNDEKVLLIVNKNTPLVGVMSGLLMTDKILYYHLIANRLGLGSKNGSIDLKSINSISFDAEDGLDTHPLSINGNKLGFLFMGNVNGLYVEGQAQYLSVLFKKLTDSKIFSRLT